MPDGLAAPHIRQNWLQAGETCWRVETATRLAFLVDGEEYFGAVRAALARARRSFYILGWDINSHMKLVPGGAGDGLPEELGPFLNALVARQKGVRGYVLGWDYAMLYALEREWWSFLRFGQRSGLVFRLDDRHPLGASHHQKVVVVDDTVAFVSGFDLAPSRWDTSEHLCEHPLRKNGVVPYGPFHDVGAMVEGPCASALAELCRERWRRATGRRVRVRSSRTDESPWPENVPAVLTDVQVGISRTEPPFEDRPAVSELRHLHLSAIARARRFVFGENQYFTSTIVAEALANRLAEPDPPDIALLMPTTESGWLETSTMGVLRARVHALLRAADRAGRYRMYCPVHSCNAEPACINVHSKVLIVDDELLTLGSANLANRSLCLDTECNLALEARGDPRIRDAIAGLRARLLGEHLGVDPRQVLASAAGGASLHDVIAALQDPLRRHLEVIEPAVDPAVDAVVPDHEVLDPDGPLDAEVLIADLLPARRSRERVRARVIAVVILAIAVAALALAWRYTSLAQFHLADEIVALARQTQASPWAPFAVIAIFVVGGVALVPLTVLIAATAALFGPFTGIPLALAGAMASGAVTFGLGRVLERRVVRRIAGERINALSRRLQRRGLLAVLLVRLLPVAPYGIVNLVAGASRIAWRDFLLGTALGLLPGLVLTSALVDRVIAAMVAPSPQRIVALAVVVVAIIATGWTIHRKFGAAIARRR